MEYSSLQYANQIEAVVTYLTSRLDVSVSEDLRKVFAVNLEGYIKDKIEQAVVKESKGVSIRDDVFNDIDEVLHASGVDSNKYNSTSDSYLYIDLQTGIVSVTENLSGESHHLRNEITKPDIIYNPSL